MLPPDSPIPHWTLTLTLARIDGPQSHRLSHVILFKTRTLTDALTVYHSVENNVLAILSQKGGDTDAT